MSEKVIQVEKIKENQAFIGREFEKTQLENIIQLEEASIIIMYGRRRVGKTELLEQVFRKRKLLKFEGIEQQNQAAQQSLVLRQLSHYTNNPLIKHLKIDSWLDVFETIASYTETGIWTIYFEEVQWLANYQNDFISQLKLVWDNKFKRNNNLIMILCGSSPSFMIKNVLHSRALYNRSQHEFHLKPLSLQETKLFYPKHSDREIMNAYLTIGGIPEYLKRLKKASVFSTMCANSFLPHSYFSQEYHRIFVSSLSDNPHYQKIIEFLSLHRFATREQLANYLEIKSGGGLTELLNELALCGFIKKYAPYNLGADSKLARFQIDDYYLQFFFKFIQPKLNEIEQGKYQLVPTSAMNIQNYQQWLGYAFERFCRSQAHHIASLLGFSGVKYTSGVYYNRATQKQQPGFQIDLLFDRDDQVITICEIKYTQTKIGTEIIDSFEKKLTCFYEQQKGKKQKTIQKVLICIEGVDRALTTRHYFDHIIVLSDFFKS